MARYNFYGTLKDTDLLKLGDWHVLDKKEFEREEYGDISYDEMLKDGRVTLWLPSKATSAVLMSWCICFAT